MKQVILDKGISILAVTGGICWGLHQFYTRRLKKRVK